MKPAPWKHGSQEYVLHSVPFKFTSLASHQEDLECAMILDPRMVPLIPTSFLAVVPSHPSCFEVRSAGEKGAGMFAIRDISAGNLIISEHPAIIIPSASLPRDYGAYEALYQALPENIRIDLLKMANWKSIEECSHEEGIARTNGTDVDLLFPDEMKGDKFEHRRAREYGATFLKIDRCNHSCSPNAAHKWDVASFASHLYALRDIKVGEEICITYTDVTAPMQTRREKLRKSYGFVCNCDACRIQDGEEREKSDFAREELHDWRFIHPSYGRWWKDMCRADDTVIKSHQRALHLIEQEGAQVLQCAFIEEIALCYAALGNEEEFIKWGKTLIGLCQVPNPQLALQFEVWLGNPTSMKAWAWRRKQRRQASRGVSTSEDLCDLSLLLSLELSQ